MSELIKEDHVSEFSEYLAKLAFFCLSDIEKKDNDDTKGLHGGLLKIYREVEEVDLTPFIAHMDFLSNLLDDFSCPKINFQLEKPIQQNVCFFDFKINNSVLYLAVYYAVNNAVAEVCLKEGFNFYTKKRIWVKSAEIKPGSCIRESLQTFDSFFNEIKKVCRLIVKQDTLVKFYRVK